MGFLQDLFRSLTSDYGDEPQDRAARRGEENLRAAQAKREAAQDAYAARGVRRGNLAKMAQQRKRLPSDRVFEDGSAIVGGRRIPAFDSPDDFGVTARPQFNEQAGINPQGFNYGLRGMANPMPVSRLQGGATRLYEDDYSNTDFAQPVSYRAPQISLYGGAQQGDFYDPRRRLR